MFSLKTEVPFFESGEESSDEDESPSPQMHEIKTSFSIKEDPNYYPYSETESNEDHALPNWSDYQSRRATFSYSGNGGIRKSIPSDVTPAQVFNLLVDDEVIELVRTETNRYYLQTKASNASDKFSPFSNDEIRKYFGLIIWMGLIRLGKLENYWSTSILYKNSVASKTMSRFRFLTIHRHLHFADNEGVEPKGKIQPLIDLLQKKFKELYTPEENVVLIESLVPWRGRHELGPSCTYEVGIKIFKLLSSEGYCWSLQLSGEESEEHALSICKNLTEGLRNEGRSLYIDNLNISYELAKYFLEEGTHVVGKINANSNGFPKEVLAQKLSKGEVICKEEENGIVIFKWRDANREVRLLSTKHSPQLNEVENNSSNSKRSRLTKPTVLSDYNKSKSGVYKQDNGAADSSVLRRGIKWYRKLGLELLFGVAVINAHTLYKKSTNSCIGIREFRESLCLSFLGPHLLRDGPEIRSSRHFLSEVPNKCATTRRKCTLCYKILREKESREVARRKSKMVNTQCVQCGNKPFCLTCFAKHHS